MTYNINCTETAKLVRKALKENFPGIKFSVKKSPGGSSIYVRWTDGPGEKSVESIVNFFEGATFDPSFDSKSYVSQEWNGEEVQFGADYVICQRDYSRSYAEAIVSQFCKRWGIPLLKIDGNEQHARVYTHALSYEMDQRLRMILRNTDVKDIHRVYEAQEEQEARARAQWEAGAAERKRKQREQAAKAEKERQEQERRAEEARKQREAQERERARQTEEVRKENQRRENIRLIQRTALASRANALAYLKLPLTATRADVVQAFRSYVKSAATEKGGYDGDMDFLVKVKEKALQ